MTNEAAAGFLRWIAIALIAMGVLMALMASPGVGAPIAASMNALYGFADGTIQLDQFHRLLSAVGGGLTAGLGATFFFVIAPLLERGDPLARRGGLISALTWYGIDSGGSLAAGVPLNALINTAFLALILAPLILAGKRSASGEASAG